MKCEEVYDGYWRAYGTMNGYPDLYFSVKGESQLGAIMNYMEKFAEAEGGTCEFVECDADGKTIDATEDPEDEDPCTT